jgi:hypothetical protein
MARPEVRLVARLKAITAVAALVSDRVYPVLLPQGEPLPALVYEIESDRPEGAAKGNCTAARIQLTVHCIGETTSTAHGYGAAHALADAVRGDCSTTSASGVASWVDADGRVWRMEDSNDEIIELAPGEGAPAAYSVRQSYSTWYTIT